MLANIKQAYQWYKSWGGVPCWNWIKAAEAYRHRNYHKALEYYQAGFRKHPEHAARFCAMTDMSYCYFKTSKFPEAINKLKNVLKHLPYSKEAHRRLAQIYFWTGNVTEAVWLLRQANKKFPRDTDFLTSFIFALADNGGPELFIKEAFDQFSDYTADELLSPNLKLARALWDYNFGDSEKGEKGLRDLADNPLASLNIRLAYAKVLLDQEAGDEARYELKLAMRISPEDPRVLSLIAQSYFMESEDDDQKLIFSLQTATSAAQLSAWQSPGDLHLLAKIYNSYGDRYSALLFASKAQEIIMQRADNYKDIKNLDELISTLSSGTVV